MTENTPPRPPNKVDYLVERCLQRCRGRESPLTELAEMLATLALVPTWTEAELSELRERATGELANRISDQP